MANNCLLTRLNAVVNNDNLEHYDMMFVTKQQASYNPATRKLDIKASGGDITLTIIDGSIYFTDSAGSSNLGTTATVSNGQTKSVYYSNGVGKISLLGKYYIASLSGSSDSMLTLDPKMLSNIGLYSNEKPSITCPGYLSGDITGAKLGEFNTINFAQNVGLYGTLDPNLKVSVLINLQYSRIVITTAQLAQTGSPSINYKNNGGVLTGNVTGFVHENLSSVAFTGVVVEGTVEDFFAKCFEVSTETRNVTIECELNFHGTARSGAYTGSISTSGVSVSHGGNVIGTYNGSTWSYS